MCQLFTSWPYHIFMNITSGTKELPVVFNAVIQWSHPEAFAFLSDFVNIYPTAVQAPMWCAGIEI